MYAAKVNLPNESYFHRFLKNKLSKICCNCVSVIYEQTWRHDFQAWLHPLSTRVANSLYVCSLSCTNSGLQTMLFRAIMSDTLTSTTS